MSKKKIKQKYIEIQNATLHNLKGVNTKIPRNKLTVITGLSGSGKSSLAFDTLYAEGQRRFVESLSSYARQFLERMSKPDVDSIDGLPPAIAIEQHKPNKNPRSTVGTTTEIYDYLRLLFGRIGKTYDKVTGNLVRKDTAENVFESLADLEDGSKLILMSEFDVSVNKDSINSYVENGYYRIVDEEYNIIDLESDGIPKDFNCDRYTLLIDRLVFRKDEESKTRFTDSLEKAFNLGDGRIRIYSMNDSKLYKFSNHFEDSESGIEYSEPDPKIFSFNNPQGACHKCQGFGRTIEIDENLVIPDMSLSIERGAIAAFKGETHSSHLDDLLDIANSASIDVTVPVSELPEDKYKLLWEGFGRYIGIDGFFKKIEDKLYKIQNRVLLSRYRGYTTCKACNGSRLRTSARQVFIEGMNVPKLINLPLWEVKEFVDSLKLSEYEQTVVGEVVKEISWRLELLVDIGLQYLTLARLSHTLSGGEAQRINLSTALGSSLVGTLYVLDEPSIGLHSTDTKRLIKILYKLRDLGNTIVVVEHDPEVISAADNIIDMGKGAGALGGEIVFEGNVDKLLSKGNTLTADYMSGRKKIPIAKNKREGNGNSIVITKPKENNLRMDQVKFPLNKLVVITGVSGSGKSTLVNNILYAGVKRFRGGFKDKIGKYQSISGIEHIDNIELVDQSAIGKSSRSTPATYTKVFDYIRELYSNLQEAKQLGWKPGYFSFNVNGGRCDVCDGQGYIIEDMQFLPDVRLVCESCNGTRYKREVRNLEYNGKSIVDVLDMTITEAINFFESHDKIVSKLQVLEGVGLGYLKLGQASTELSGGEAQRIKLSSHLETNNKNRTLFIFDEPTTGLHLHDVSRLLDSFNKLIDNGHSVVIIEHNIELIATADHIIDLGPGAGYKGGNIVAEGTPEDIIKVDESLTSESLKKYMKFYNSSKLA
ncbi:MAG: excinuclease ABC subunit UvrA [Chlorobiota bacterium]